MAEVTRAWDTYYILPSGASYAGDNEVLGFWRGLLGQNVIELSDIDAVCETIALTIGLGEDVVGLDEGLADLRRRRLGRRARGIQGAGRIGAGRQAARPGRRAPDDLDGPSGNIRL